MLTIKKLNNTCSKKCKDLEHATSINKAIWESSLTDEKLAAFIAKRCENFAEIIGENVGCFFF